MLDVAQIARSVYHYWIKKLESKNGVYNKLVNLIKKIVHDNKMRYGYRRVTLTLKKLGFIINHKKVLRIMRENNLLCTKFTRRSRSLKTYKGQIGKVAKNMLNRRFKTDRPLQKLVSDVTQFNIKGSNVKLYLSTILDIYSGEVISFSISKSPQLSFAMESLITCIDKLKNLSYRTTIHTDQGWHYQHNSWVSTLKENNIFQSMSRKGNCLDNAPMENFFGLLKQEMFYGMKYDSYDVLKKNIIQYIKYYNHDRIKTKLNGMSPVEYRENFKVNIL
ncbi:transposase [Mammaliicoccus lentus]|nr:transposase [Mammaliicoccus lentus]